MTVTGPRVTSTGLQSSATAAASIKAIQWAAAAGTVNAITAAFSPTITSITDGLAVGVRTTSTNTIVNPTFNPDSNGAHTIVKNYNEALEPGDIQAEAILRWNAANSVWVLENPATMWREITEWATAGGTVDAITVSYTPAHGSLKDGEVFGFRAAGANATTAPTLAIDTLTAYQIYRNGKVLVQAGDIYGANAEHVVRYHYDATTPWFELLNPALPPDPTFGNLAKIDTADDTGGTNVNTAQPWFSANGGVTVKAQAYQFVGFLRLSRAAGSTSHTTAILFALANGAAVTEIYGTIDANDGDDALAGLVTLKTIEFNAVGGAVAKGASTSTTEQALFRVSGTVVFSAGGKFTPQFQYSAAPGGTPTIKKGSFFAMRAINANPQGTWA